MEDGHVKIYWSHTLEEILGDDNGVIGISIIDVQSEVRKEINLAGVFIAVGHKPNTEIFRDQLEMNNGYIQLVGGNNGNATETSVSGVFAAGDVADHVYRQAITSAGSGCMAALDAEKFLDK